jgi:hypothetical protein
MDGSTHMSNNIRSSYWTSSMTRFLNEIAQHISSPGTSYGSIRARDRGIPINLDRLFAATNEEQCGHAGSDICGDRRGAARARHVVEEQGAALWWDLLQFLT